MENIPRYHSNCTAVSHRTPQAHSKPYAFTQQSRMSSTEIRCSTEDACCIRSSHQLRGYKSRSIPSGFHRWGNIIPTPHSLYGDLYRNSPRQRFYILYYIIPCLDLSIYIRKFSLFFQCFSMIFRFCQYQSLFLWILPEIVLGSSSLKTITRGYLYGAVCDLTYS